MRFPTGHEVQRLRSSERNFSRVFLGVQKGKELGDYSTGTLMVGQHYTIVAADGYTGAEHFLYFNAVSLVGTDIRPNMTLLVGTAADSSAYGSVRVRAIGLGSGPGGADGLYLEPNDLSVPGGHLIAGDRIWVDGVYRLYRKLPYIRTGTVYEDGNANSTNPGAPSPGWGAAYNAHYYDRPVALMGSPRFAWTGENVDFYGWRSYGRGGWTIRNWTWDFDGGVCRGPGIGFPGSPMYPIHARWNSAGEYIASLVVEDNSTHANLDIYGVQFRRHRAVRPVLVYDRPGEGPNTPYMDFEVESLTGKYGSGWTARIKVFGTADKSEFPDNALVILYAEDWYGGQGGSIGGWYGQEGILFCGYIRADSVAADFEKSTVSFEAQTIEQWMKDISVWPANFISTAGAWHGFANMTIEDILWHLAEIHSNLKDVTDCFFASDIGAEKRVDFLDLTEATLYDQMSSQIGSCFFGQLSAGRHGSVNLFKHKNMQDIVERAFWGPPVYSFSKQDWYAEIEIGEERMRDSVAQVEMAGFVYDANGNPLDSYSLAPGRQTNFGGIEKVSGILLTGNTVGPGTPSQAENNTLAGLYLAWKNIRFPQIRIHARNNRILEPSEQDYFAVTLVAADTVRGYVWAGKEFWTTTVSLKINNENGTILVDVEGEASTWGPDGVAGDYPSGPPEDPAEQDPPFTNPPGFVPTYPPGQTPENPDGDPPDWGSEDETDFPIMAYLGLRTGEVIRGSNLGWGLADHGIYHNCGQVHADGIYWMALDEFDPENTAMVVTPRRVYRTANLSVDTPDFELTLPFWAGGEYIMVRSSPVQQGLWMVVGLESGVSYVSVWVTENGGDDWVERHVAGPWDSDACLAFLEMSSHDSQAAWVMWVDVTTAQAYIAVTDDRFASSLRTNFTTTYGGCFDGDPGTAQRPVCHHRGYANSNDSDAIYGGVDVAGADDIVRIYYSPTCTTLYTDSIPAGIANVRVVGCGIGTSNGYWALAYDDDAFGFWAWVYDEDTEAFVWTEQHNWAFPGAMDGKNLRFNWQAYILAHGGNVYPCSISIDRGVTWTHQWGNWAQMLTDEGIGATGVNVVCPVFEV